MIRYSLPFPRSTNNLFVNTPTGRSIEQGYRAWKKAAGEEIQTQGRKRLHGAVSVSIALVRPDKRRRDIDNLIKGILDLLVGMAVIDDDSLVQKISIQWIPSGDPCTVLIHQAEAELAA